MINFSDLFKQTSGHCYYSPDSSLLASSISFRLVIRDAKTLETIHVWKCLDEINKISWSPDSSLILVILKKRNTLQIYNIDDVTWKCKIDFAHVTVADAVWLSDSRHFMSIDELNVRIQLWSLISKSVSVLTGVKSIKRGVSILEDRVAVLENKKAAKDDPNGLIDYCSILQYNSKSHVWQKLTQFKLPTKNATDINFTPDGTYLIIKDSPVHNRTVYVHDSISGKIKTKISKINEVSNNFSLDHLFNSLPCTLHVCTPNLLAFGNLDNPEISLVSKLSFKNLANLDHKEVVDKVNAAVYFEVARKAPVFNSEIDIITSGSNAAQAQPGITGSKFEIADLPYHLPVDTSLSNSISWLRLSHNNEFLASQRSNMKRVVYIWGNLIDDNNSIKAPHSIIETLENIKCAAWSPKSNKLAICTGNDKIYLWSEESILSIENPNDVRFGVVGLRWSGCGRYLILMSRTQMMICFV